MLTLRPSAERGHADHGWLQSAHSFSFASYQDPAHMGWGNLRVINEDFIQPGQGFGTHGHQDMEIITYVVSGELSHRDSLGNGATILPGEMQRMSAGRGIRHSEFSHPQVTTHLLQIWIQPNVRGIEPSYEQRAYDPTSLQGQLSLMAAQPGRGAVVSIHADAALYAGRFAQGQTAELPLQNDRKAYVQVVKGQIEVNGQALGAGDAALLSHENLLRLAAISDPAPSSAEVAEVLVFDLAA
jgi:quercetin 2,3-dioxygenase